jgi:hypothetical protein
LHTLLRVHFSQEIVGYHRSTWLEWVCDIRAPSGSACVITAMENTLISKSTIFSDPSQTRVCLRMLHAPSLAFPHLPSFCGANFNCRFL